MIVKIDTKERFTVIKPDASDLSANMTEAIRDTLLPYLQKDIPHIVLNLEKVASISQESALMISSLQQIFYDKHCSFVICCLQKSVEEALDKLDILEVLNVTPTESEAYDILQMEEIERELTGEE